MKRENISLIEAKEVIVSEEKKKVVNILSIAFGLWLKKVRGDRSSEKLRIALGFSSPASYRSIETGRSALLPSRGMMLAEYYNQGEGGGLGVYQERVTIILSVIATMGTATSQKEYTELFNRYYKNSDYYILKKFLRPIKNVITQFGEEQIKEEELEDHLKRRHLIDDMHDYLRSTGRFMNKHMRSGRIEVDKIPSYFYNDVWEYCKKFTKRMTPMGMEEWSEWEENNKKDIIEVIGLCYYPTDFNPGVIDSPFPDFSYPYLQEETFRRLTIISRSHIEQRPPSRVLKNYTNEAEAELRDMHQKSPTADSAEVNLFYSLESLLPTIYDKIRLKVGEDEKDYKNIWIYVLRESRIIAIADKASHFGTLPYPNIISPTMENTMILLKEIRAHILAYILAQEDHPNKGQYDTWLTDSLDKEK